MKGDPVTGAIKVATGCEHILTAPMKMFLKKIFHKNPNVFLEGSLHRRGAPESVQS